MSEAILKEALEELTDLDDRLGKKFAKQVGDDNEKSGEAMIAMASAHLERSITILRLVGGKKLSAHILYARADSEAANA